MSHLGERVSALVDGELRHADRERALAHLTFCADCRAEVESVRALKARLRSMEGPAMPVDLTMSLLRMADPGGPMPPRERPFPSTFGGVPIPGPYTIAPLDNRPRRSPFAGSAGPGRTPGRRRSSYVAVSVVSAAVALGTLFVVAGQDSGPAVRPPVEVFKTAVPGGPSGSSAAHP
jgi:anti-sigma factor RsiW